MSTSRPPYGPVIVEDWFDESRICYYDDDDMNDEGEHVAVVYPGDMPLAVTVGSYEVPHLCLRELTTEDLWNRREKLHEHIGLQALAPKADGDDLRARYELLLELAFVDGILMDRLHEARFHVRGKNRVRVFISHSSKDKKFANWLSIDLANAGHKPWLDDGT